ncbi:MAG TPA: sodium:solute symporter family protein [Methanothrix soehngenii]|jgi:solute:Na+ symporter, SSS family|uniref:sodium:solute symporter family protein n=1 Tax=Methanothrix TaxID=2222 RepID=UPI002C9C4FE5|nr:sodium:solute symporter family protein [Methanothrix soehngenii]HOE44329.1 sodium:solute symporter family protein [Methanothrix soehngenii]HPL21129.1 sodium:solute symporter family protein [Methanothrix soehngenii]
MDAYSLFLVFLAIYIAILLGIGLYFSRRQRSETDFWLAGRELGPISIGLAAASAWTTASALLLATGLFLLYGIGSIWIWVFPNIAGLAIIAAISGRIKNIPALTQPELMEIRYDPMIRAPVAIAVTIMMILFSVTDFIGFKMVLGTFFGIEPIFAIAIMAVSVALYVGVGGFRAVVWTDMVQYILLAGLAAYVAHMALGLSANEGVSLIAASSMLGADWWDIFSMGGILGALVFIVALVPGWVAEQDPWQKVWAARDDRSAKRGLLLGATLLVLIYSFCLLAAIGLSVIYPRPGNEMEAEMLYLRIISDNVPGWLLGLLTIGFAAASMSCTDTFATSGASCLSRDLVQRHLWPTATVKEMLILNRILIVIMVFISALIALNVDSIMDAVIIATVIGTTSYFFPIIGGLYWKRATKWGAMAALVAGGGTQILLVSYEQFWLKAPLDSISPYMVEHGVLVGLSLSALFFVGVSLATRQAEDIRLAPFFPDIAERVFQGDLPRADRTNPDYLKIASDIEEKSAGDRIHLRLTIEYSRAHEEAGHQLLMWKPFIEKLQERHPVWFTPTGSHVAYRLSQADMQACIKMVHGTSRQIWLNSEPRLEEGDRQRDELVIAYQEIGEVLLELGLQASPRT